MESAPIDPPFYSALNHSTVSDKGLGRKGEQHVFEFQDVFGASRTHFVDILLCLHDAKLEGLKS